MEDDPSPEEIRRRRLAYFQSSQTGNVPQEEVNQGKEHPHSVTEKSMLIHVPGFSELPENVPLHKSAQNYSNLDVPTDDDIQSLKHQRTEQKSNDSHYHVTVASEDRKYMPEHSKQKSEGKDTVVEVTKTGKPDGFSLLREELRLKAQTGDEEGYNLAVERLISLAKKEIAETENQKHLSNSHMYKQRQAKHNESSYKEKEIENQKQSSSSHIYKQRQNKQNEFSYEEKAKLAPSVTSPKTSGGLPQQRKTQRSDSSPQYEELFDYSKSRKRASESQLLQESHEQHEFQKSVGNIDDLGLSTHRPEDKPSLERHNSNETKLERKYKEFTVKSTKEMDLSNNDRGSGQIEKSENGMIESQVNRFKGSGLHLNLYDERPDQRDLTVDKNYDHEKPRLHRPKSIPSNIYQQDNEDETENLSLPPSYRNYEPVQRNVVFSADEIYHQAFQGQGQSPAMSQNKSYHGNPLFHSRDYMPMQDGHNSVPKSSYPQGGHPFPVSPYPPQHFAPHGFFRMPHPPSVDNLYTSRSQQGQLDTYRSMQQNTSPRNHVENKYPRPDITDQSPTFFPPHYPQNVAPMQYYEGYMAPQVPHSPEAYYIPPQVPQSPDGRYMQQQWPRPPEVPFVHRGGDAGKPQNFGRPVHPFHDGSGSHLLHSPRLPYPGGDGSFKHYLNQMPAGIPYPPPPYNVDLNSYFGFVQSQGYPTPYPVPVQNAQMFSKEAEEGPKAAETEDKELVEMMVPHPPLQKKDNTDKIVPRKSSPRRTLKQDDRTVKHDGKHSSKRQEGKGSSQKPEASISIKQHETSTSQKQEGKSSTQRHVDEIRQFHEQRRQQEAEEDALLEKQRKFAKSSIDRYFTSLEKLYHRDKQQEQLEEPVIEEIEEVIEDSPREETDVQTEVTMATSIKPEGITERMNSLGIDLSHLKDRNDKKPREGDKDQGKSVIVCTECGEVNKAYMSWCADCGESLAGIELTFIKKSKSRSVSKSKEQSKKKSDESGDNSTEKSQSINKTKDKTSKKGHVISDSSSGKSSLKENSRKSESRDSGRPSSEDQEVSHNEQEIAEICQHVTDPVLRGFIKSYYRKKQGDTPNGQEDKHSVHVKTSDISTETFDKTNKSQTVKQTSSSFPTDEVGKEKNVTVFHNFDMTDFVTNNEVNNPLLRDTHLHQTEQKHFEDMGQDNGHAQQSFAELSHNASKLKDKMLSKHIEDEDVWFHERKKKTSQSLKHKSSAPIDVEIFSMEESRQQRDSSRSAEKIVPSLNLCISSDEDQPVALDVSTDSENWQDFFVSKPKRSDEEIPKIEDSVQPKPFLEQLIGDLKTPVPEKSPKKPVKGKHDIKVTRSIVRDSIEAPGYERKWQRSSIAWSSYHPRELSTKSTLQRPSSAGKKVTQSKDNQQMKEEDRRKFNRRQRPVSADVSRRKRVSEQDVDRRASETSLFVNREEMVPANSDTPRSAEDNGEMQTINEMHRGNIHNPIVVNETGDAQGGKKKNSTTEEQVGGNKKSLIGGIRVLDVSHPRFPPKSKPTTDKDSPQPDLPGLVDHRLPVEDMPDLTSMADPATVLDAYHKYHEMTPRIREGEFSAWLCLPDEILLHILSYLPHSDLASCARTCKHFYRVAMDDTLWRYITIRKNHNLTDEALVHIGNHHPVSLALIQCHGDYVTAKGLRDLFRLCANTLRELNFFGCSRGALTGDCILLHAAARCKRLTHVDASWCNVSDSGIGAMSSSTDRLESLCINGCQMITNEGLETVLKKHGNWLRVLEMFGCFNITPKGIRYLASHCINLQTLNLGQCYKLNDSCISQLSSSLGKIEILDLRGCKQIKDNCMRHVVKNCPRLQTLTLANCPNISDISILEISTYMRDIRSIDVCGCRNITDNSIRALTNNCVNLRHVDISSTGCTHRSVSMLANFSSQRLESAKLNFLSDITENAVIKLVKHCKRLNLLHLYGCTSIRTLCNIRGANPKVRVEM